MLANLMQSQPIQVINSRPFTHLLKVLKEVTANTRCNEHFSASPFPVLPTYDGVCYLFK